MNRPGARVPELLLITDPHHPGGPVEAMTRALSEAPPGRVAVQVRARGFPDRDVLEWAQALREATNRAEALLLINARIDIARAVDADGVHLPEHGLTVTQARRVLGTGAIVGASRHSARGLTDVAQQGADYATLSPIGNVPHKAAPLGVEGFLREAASCELPVLALGGIAPEDVAPLVRAGAHGIALLRAVYATNEPESLALQWLQLLDTARPQAG